MDDAGLQEARQRIQQARESGATSLNLSFIPLNAERSAALISNIGRLTNLTNLTTLHLQRNRLSSLPRELGPETSR